MYGLSYSFLNIVDSFNCFYQYIIYKVKNHFVNQKISFWSHKFYSDFFDYNLKKVDCTHIIINYEQV